MAQQVKQYSVCVLGLLSLFWCAICGADVVKIFRGLQGKQQDWFRTPRSLCTGTDIWNCIDYGALQSSCRSCVCPINKATFGYFDGQWKCIENALLRQEEECQFAFSNESPSSSLRILRTGSKSLINLPKDRRCQYQYDQDTNVRNCDGTWSTGSSVSAGNRYTLKSFGKYRYYLTVSSDRQAASVLQGRLVQLNITCVKNGVPPLTGCVMFKERYESRPLSCVVNLSSSLPSLTTSTMSPGITTISLTAGTARERINGTGAETTVQGNTTTAFAFGTGTGIQSTGITGFIPTRPDKPSPSPPPHGSADLQVDLELVIMIGAPTAGGVLLILVFIVCVVCWRKRKQRLNAVMYSAALYDNSQENCSAGVYDDAHYFAPVSLQKTDSILSHSNPAYGKGTDLSIRIRAISDRQPNPLTPELSDSFNFSRQERLRSEESMFVDMEINDVKMPVIYENLRHLSHQLGDPNEENQPFYAVLEGPEPDDDVLVGHPTGSLQDEAFAKEDILPDSQQHPSNNLRVNGVNPGMEHANDLIDGEAIYVNSPVSHSNDPREKSFHFPLQQQGSDNCPKEMNLKTSSSTGKRCFPGDNHVSDSGSKDNSKDLRKVKDSKASSRVNCGYDPEEKDPRRSANKVVNQLRQNKEAPNKKGSPAPNQDTYQYAALQDHGERGSSPYAALKDLSRDGIYQESVYQPLNPLTAKDKSQPDLNPKPKLKPKPKLGAKK